jgi:hypothetical protein
METEGTCNICHAIIRGIQIYELNLCKDCCNKVGNMVNDRYNLNNIPSFEAAINHINLDNDTWNKLKQEMPLWKVSAKMMYDFLISSIKNNLTNKE